MTSPSPEVNERTTLEGITMSRITTTLLVAGVLALGVAGGAGTVALNHWWLGAPAIQPVTITEPVSEPVSEPAPTLEACATEDSDDCYWDATLHGNGEGTSFIAWHGQTYTLQGTGWAELRTVDLNGEQWPYVDGLDGILYCPEGLQVGIDTTPDGHEWAGCM